MLLLAYVFVARVAFSIVDVRGAHFKVTSKLLEVMLALVQAKASPRVDVNDFEVEDGSSSAAAAFVGDLDIGGKAIRSLKRKELVHYGEKKRVLLSQRLDW